MAVLGFVARADWRYLPRHAQTEAESQAEAGGDDREPDAGNYYMRGAERGEPAGVWHGPGAGVLGFSAGQPVTAKAMETVYGELTDPETGESLGSRPRKYASHEERVARLLAAEPDASPERRAEIEFQARKQQREACHYYDLTFSPEKSWSVLYAGLRQAGMDREAEVLWECLTAGYEAGLEHLMDEACYARTGRHSGRIAGRTSGRWEKGQDWVATLWRHHTSRAGDPQLHIHGAVLNRVRLADGRWFSLDGTAIKNARLGAAAVMSRVAEAQAAQRLGVRFTDRADGLGREIAGVDERLMAQFSSRRRAIEPVAHEIADAYAQRYGRTPTPYELRLFAQQATLQTRQRKAEHAPNGDELVAQWEAEVRDALGASLASVPGAAGVHLVEAQQHAQAQGEAASQRQAQAQGAAETHGAAGAGAQAQEAAAPSSVLDERRRKLVVAQALADVTGRRARWHRANLVRALDAHLGAQVSSTVAADEQQRLLTELTAEALGEISAVKLSADPLIPAPASWRRVEDDRGLHEPPADYDRYSSQGTLARETRVVEAARELGAPQVDEARVEERLAGSSLRSEQAAAVREILTSGRRIDLVIGAAGVGKSYTLGEAARLWRDEVRVDDGVGEGAPGEGVRPRVLGLAAAENAVRVLQEDGIPRVANLRKFLNAHDQVKHGLSVRAGIRELATVRPGDLLILDEASMAPARDIEQVIEIARGSGAKLVLAGDDRQLGAVEDAGTFALLAERAENPTRITDVVRFTNDWEAAASLRLRSGDASVIREYQRHGRVVSGDWETMRAEAQRAWLADTLTGRESLIICPTNEQAAEIASHIRAELVRAKRVQQDGVELHNRCLAGVGDIVQARKNDAQLADGAGAWVANRDTYRITARHEDGSVTVRRQLPGRGDDGQAREGDPVRLPAGYVREHVELAYASTVHASQGRTVDSCYPLVDGRMELEALYVAWTRARELTVAHVVTADEPADALGPQAVEDRELTPEALLAGIVERPRSPESATQVLAEEMDARESLARLAPEWADLITTDAHARYRETLRQVLTGEEYEALTRDASFAPLLRAVRGAEAAGEDSEQLLTAAVTRRSLDGARSIGQVLYHRVTQDVPAYSDLRDAASSYAERTPELADPELSEYARAIAEAMDQRVQVLGERLAEEPPAWAEPLGPVPDDPVERAEWVRRAGIVAGYREEHSYQHEVDAIGPAPHAGAVEARQGWLAAWQALGRPDEQRDTAAASTGELANVLEAWQRKEQAAPPNVDEQLQETSIAAVFADREARMLEGTGDGSEEIRAQIDQYRAAEQAARERLADLEDAAAVRQAWYEDTAAERRAAELARNELRRRMDRELAAATAGDVEPDESRGEGDRVEPAAEQRQQARDVDEPEPVASGAVRLGRQSHPIPADVAAREQAARERLARANEQRRDLDEPQPRRRPQVDTGDAEADRGGHEHDL